MRQMRTWDDCKAFHGHECGGLAIGYQASRYAIELLDITFEDDEHLLCIAESVACPVDAIQVMLGCTIGKKNMQIDLTGQQAFNFYNFTTNESVRLSLKKLPEMDRSKMKEFILQMNYRYLFDKINTEIEPEQ